MKKLLSLVVIMFILVSISACSSNSSNEQPNDNNEVVNNEMEMVEFKIGITVDLDSHYGKGLLEMKRLLEQYSDNKMTLNIFENSKLGNERDMIEGVSMGTLDMVLSSTGPLPNFSPMFMIFDLPFIIKDRDAGYKFMDGLKGQEILDSLESKNIKGLGFWENGFRNVTNNEKEIKSPEDIKGLKIRTMENPIHLASFKQLGATPTPMAWGEVFTALQQGTIDGQENPLVGIHSTKVYEVQKYISLTEHFYSPAVLMVNKSKFDSLSSEMQDVLIKAEKEAREWEREYCRQMDTELIQTLKYEGVVITEVDKSEWQKAVEPVYKEFEDQIPADLIKALKDSK